MNVELADVDIIQWKILSLSYGPSKSNQPQTFNFSLNYITFFHLFVVEAFVIICFSLGMIKGK